MPKRMSFTCKQCGRRFSMAAHLARHSRVHAAGRPSRRRRLAVRRTPVSTLPLAGVIASLNVGRQALVAERDALSSQIAALEAALRAVGGSGQGPAARVPRVQALQDRAGYRPGSLKDYVQRVLAQAGQSMGVSEIAAAILDSGFKSKNKTLRTSVGIALADMPGVRRVKRGTYVTR